MPLKNIGTFVSYYDIVTFFQGPVMSLRTCLSSYDVIEHF